MSLASQDKAPAAAGTPVYRAPVRLRRPVWQRPVTLLAFVVMVLLVLAAIAAPWLAPQNPYDLASLSVFDNRLAPGEAGMSGTIYHMGTDDQGRDMFSAILYGIRISLIVGLVSTLASLGIGTVVGLVSAYMGGVVDAILMRLVDFVLGFPSLLVALVMLALLGRGVDKVILAIVIVHWAQYARIVRGSALVERRKAYVEAAELAGFGMPRVLLVEILPNCLGPLMVVGTLQIASSISLEATLSFLGVGVPITEPSLGLLTANGFSYLLSGEYWISFFPGATLLLLVASINIVGDRLRTQFNVRR